MNNIEILQEIKERITQDKNTFEFCKREIKGHLRSIMLIDEYIKELKEINNE